MKTDVIYSSNIISDLDFLVNHIRVTFCIMLDRFEKTIDLVFL